MKPNKEIKHLFLISIALMLSLLATPHAQAQPSHNAVQEQVLRAHLIINLLRYVKWERDNHKYTINEPPKINLCTAGNPSSTNELRKLHGVTINTHTISVIPHSETKWTSCDVLVFGDELKKTETHFELHTPLLICDSCISQKIPSAIRIVRIEEEQKPGNVVVRNGFEVDLKPAKEAGVSFGSDLLAHAIKVKGIQDGQQ
ncbi:YfiR family protein [Aurantivibrio plasticivorans]